QCAENVRDQKTFHVDDETLKRRTLRRQIAGERTRLACLFRRPRRNLSARREASKIQEFALKAKSSRSRGRVRSPGRACASPAGRRLQLTHCSPSSGLI